MTTFRNVILFVLALHGHSLRTIHRRSSKVGQIPVVNSIAKDVLKGVGALQSLVSPDHYVPNAPGDEEHYNENDPDLGLDLDNSRAKAGLYESAWAQGGGGCLSALAQQGWAAGNGYIKTHMPKNSAVPLAHTTSSGGTWMFVMTQGYLKNFPRHLKEKRPIPSIFGQRCWGYILMHNLPAEDWPVIFEKCFDGRLNVQRVKDINIRVGVNLKLSKGKAACAPTHNKDGVWPTKCKQWHLWRLFGPIKPCTGNEEDYNLGSARLSSKYAQMGFKRWYNLYKDFVWESYFKPNHIGLHGTFLSEFGNIGWNPPSWTIHSSHVVSPRCDVVPHSWPAVRDSVFQDVEVVHAAAASSEAFLTGPLIATVHVLNFGICPLKLSDIPKFLTSKPSEIAASGSIWSQDLSSSFAESTLEEGSNSTANMILQSLMHNLPAPVKSLLQEQIEFQNGDPEGVWNEAAHRIRSPFNANNKQNVVPLQIGKLSIRANVFTDPESERTTADGFLTDNNALLPLVRQMELVAPDRKEQTVINVMMTPSATRFALTDKINFFWSMQYFMPKIPRWAVFHYNRTCKEDGGAEWVVNPAQMFKLPAEFINSTETSDCNPYFFLPDFPPKGSGCTNLYKIHKEHAVFILTDLEVIPNEMYGIEGGWTVACLMFAIQVKTELSARWLEAVAPLFVKQNGPWVKDFPNYASPSGRAVTVNTYQMVPEYIAYLLQSYLEHLAYSTAYCVLNGSDGGKFRLCRSRPDLCPCHRASAKHSKFLAERFVFPQLYGNYNIME